MYCCNDSSDRIYLEFCNYQCEYSKWFDGEYDHDDDKLIALRTSYWFNDPKRGDIIIFKYPDDETEWFIKRVIALPGETVLVKDGKVYINGSKKALSEPYIKEEPVEDFGPYKVPKNGYFVMGDNRNNSNDAREWETHYVSRDEVLGKAWFRYYPSIKVIK